MSTFVQVSRVTDFTGQGRRYLAGNCFLFWQDGTRAVGTMMWGRPLEADIAAMIPFFEVGAHPRFAGHASFVDARGIDSIDLLAFGKLLKYLIDRRHVFGPHIRRQGILHPLGFVGVVVSGALQVARPPYPFACFTEADAAFSWAGVGDLAEPLEALRRGVSRVPEVVRGVRDALARGIQRSDRIATELGLSPRTLQRRLEEAGTSLREERRKHLSVQIEELLGGTELDLEAIAAQVGLTSAAHLVRHFKATHGTTPSAWRESRRAMR